MTGPAPRRERLLAAAAALFAERGFHDVGIDDIGSAAGISGPGVYRHFPSKAALLEALCDRAMDRMLEGARRLREQHDDPASALHALVGLHADFAARSGPLLGVWLREQRALSDDARRSLRRRQRAYEQIWREVAAPLRPDLAQGELAVVVGAALTLLNATAVLDAPVPAERVRDLLQAAALAALRA
jgi:AcrR family transcriptional regulator